MSEYIGSHNEQMNGKKIKKTRTRKERVADEESIYKRK